MRIKSFIILMLLICSAPAIAGEPWSKGEVALEVVYQTLQFIDYNQTLSIAADDEYTENNIFLGKNPQEEYIHAYFLATALGHIAVTEMLPPKYRRIWQMITIGIEAGYVSHNYSIGVHISIH